MTARPLDPESRRRPQGKAVALVLVMVAVLLAAGCTLLQSTNAVSTNITEMPTRATLKVPTPIPITPLPTSETPAACLSETSTNNSAEGKYIFLEHNINTNHVNVSGLCHPLSVACYRSPSFTYSFNEPDGVLAFTDNCYQNHLNDSLMLFYGFEDNDTFDMCGHGNTGLYVHSFPMQTADNVTLVSLAGDGAVTLRYHDNPIVLKPKERWENITRLIKSTPKSGEGEEFLPGCDEEVITTDSLYNAGIFDKKKIVFRI